MLYCREHQIGPHEQVGGTQAPVQRRKGVSKVVAATNGVEHVNERGKAKPRMPAAKATGLSFDDDLPAPARLMRPAMKASAAAKVEARGGRLPPAGPSKARAVAARAAAASKAAEAALAADPSLAATGSMAKATRGTPKRVSFASAPVPIAPTQKANERAAPRDAAKGQGSGKAAHVAAATGSAKRTIATDPGRQSAAGSSMAPSK